MASKPPTTSMPLIKVFELRPASRDSCTPRKHFARFLVDSGVCADTYVVFRRFLTDNKPGYVPHQWARLGDAVRWITQAGGVAVIAHPARYRFTPTVEYALIKEFIAHGGRGLEVMTGSHSAPEQLQYGDTALEFGLLASRFTRQRLPCPRRKPHRTWRPARPAGPAEPRLGALAASAESA